MDDWGFAVKGIGLATREWRFWVAFVVAFLVFGTLMNLLAGGTAAFDLMRVAGWSTRFSIIGNAGLALFGVGRGLLDWALVFAVTVLQATAVGMLAVVWQKRAEDTGTKNSEHAQRTGLGAAVAVLGTGCPTCGTTLLGPLAVAVFGSSGIALAGTISGLMTVVAVVLLLGALEKSGYEAFVILTTKMKGEKR